MAEFVQLMDSSFLGVAWWLMLDWNVTGNKQNKGETTLISVTEQKR